jgi:hypothetical protein
MQCKISILFFIAFALSISSPTGVSAQNIDTLQSPDAIVAFVRKQMPYYKSIYIDPQKRLAADESDDSVIRSLSARTVEKADFDNNGQTDLLFNGYVDFSPDNKVCFRISVVILSFGNDSFRSIWLSNGLDGLFAAKTINSNGRAYLKTIAIRTGFGDSQKQFIKYATADTLMCVENNFIEKSDVVDFKFNELEFRVSRIFVPPEDFCETIQGDSVKLEVSSKFYGGSMIDSGGAFYAKLEPAASAEIYNLLKYINPNRFKDHYAVDAKDAGHLDLRMSYDNNKINEVSDYGMSGPFALSTLENMLFDLLDRTDWQKWKSP